MFAAHFAAALAIKSHVPRTPTWAVMTGVVVPDFVWIVLANRGIEPAAPNVFFDDWSHSLLMVIVTATVFSSLFWRYGRAVILALWLAVFSHFIVDLPIHPKFLALYPHSSVHVGLFVSGTLGAMKYWWVQLCVVVVLMLIYILGARRLKFQPNLIAASCVLLLSLHLLMFPG